MSDCLQCEWILCGLLSASSSAFDVMVAVTRSSLPWVPHTWMSQILCRPPELGIEGRTRGPYLPLCLVVEWPGLQVMFYFYLLIPLVNVQWKCGHILDLHLLVGMPHGNLYAHVATGSILITYMFSTISTIRWVNLNIFSNQTAAELEGSQ